MRWARVEGRKLKVTFATAVGLMYRRKFTRVSVYAVLGGGCLAVYLMTHTFR